MLLCLPLEEAPLLLQGSQSDCSAIKGWIPVGAGCCLHRDLQHQALSAASQHFAVFFDSLCQRCLLWDIGRQFCLRGTCLSVASRVIQSATDVFGLCQYIWGMSWW